MNKKVYLSGGFALVAFVFVFATNGFSFFDTRPIRSEIATLTQVMDEARGSLPAQLITNSPNLSAGTATNITSTTATLQGNILNLNAFMSSWGLPANRIVYYFQYSTSPLFPSGQTFSSGYRVATNIPAGGRVSANVFSLIPATSYNFRLCVAGSGTTHQACSTASTFATPAAQVVNLPPVCAPGTTSIQITSPNTNQYFEVGTPKTIEWQANGGTTSVFKISLSYMSGSNPGRSTIVSSSVVPVQVAPGTYRATVTIPKESYHGSSYVRVECTPQAGGAAIFDTSNQSVSVGTPYGMIEYGGHMGQSLMMFRRNVPMEFTNDFTITARGQDLYIDKDIFVGNTATAGTMGYPGLTYDIMRTAVPNPVWLSQETTPVIPTPIRVTPMVFADFQNPDGDGAGWVNGAVDMGTTIKIPAGQKGYLVLRGTFTPTVTGYYAVIIYKVPFSLTNTNGNMWFQDGTNYIRGAIKDIFTVIN